MARNSNADWQKFSDPQCRGCRYSSVAGGVACCSFFERENKSRVALNGGLPLPEVCQQRKPRTRGKSKKGEHA